MITKPSKKLASLFPVLFGITVAGCGGSGNTQAASPAIPQANVIPNVAAAAAPERLVAPNPDPRIGLSPGLFDAEEAIWNLRLVSSTPPPSDFVGVTNSDLAFKGDIAIQGNYNGIQFWDISNPARPSLVEGYVCPASQSDVSVYGDLLFVSGEGQGGRLDCGTQGVQTAVSADRLRGIRIFDISDISNPEYIGNVQTCRGSHTHTLLKDPDDNDNVYIYVSGSSSVRPAAELAGCSGAQPEDDPNTALFRIEVIQVPLDNPAAARIVNSPRIFEDLVAPPGHGLAPADVRALEEARARGAFIVELGGQSQVVPDGLVRQINGGQDPVTAEDSARVRQTLDNLVAQNAPSNDESDGPAPGPTQCHDITVYPDLGLAGGACEGYGLLLDISNPTNPVRIDAVSDSNFAYWHSATFNNDGTKILFTDEWGGGGQPKCRIDDPVEWGANAYFSIENRRMSFQSYYKLPAPQTEFENCVAHNGSLIPVPGRDIFVQGWYQGGISISDWTDITNPVEIAFHDRGPSADGSQGPGGSWSVYWYNGLIVSSEISRGLDVFELTPSPAMTQNEIDAAKSVVFEQFNAQEQPSFVWPASFALSRAYVDQLARSRGLSLARVAGVRAALNTAEAATGAARGQALNAIANELRNDVSGSSDADKVTTLIQSIRDLALASR